MNGMVCFLTVLMLVLSSGCSSDRQAPPAETKKSSPEKTVKAGGASPSAAAKAAPIEQSQQTPVKEYSYDATGKADPFEPLVAAIEPAKQAPGSAPVRPASDKPLTPLQKYDLSDLFLVAVVYADNNTAALIEDNARNGYIVREGMLVGRNDGVIKKILKNSMIVEEKITDSTGNTETKISTLTVHKKD